MRNGNFRYRNHDRGVQLHGVPPIGRSSRVVLSAPTRSMNHIYHWRRPATHPAAYPRLTVRTTSSEPSILKNITGNTATAFSMRR